jgi:hypothetical protein
LHSDNSQCAESESVFKYSSAHQVPEIILYKSSKNTENALID